MEMKMRVACALVCGAATLACAGCGDGEGSGSNYEIASGTLSGKINGTAWKFQVGGTDDFLSDEKGFFTTLYAEKADACGFFSPTADIILVKIPKTAGDYELGFSQSLTFAHESDNKVSTTGLLTVEKVTDTTIDAGVYAIFDDDPNYEVSGHFSVSICPPTP